MEDARGGRWEGGKGETAGEIPFPSILPIVLLAEMQGRSQDFSKGGSQRLLSR